MSETLRVPRRVDWGAGSFTRRAQVGVQEMLRIEVGRVGLAGWGDGAKWHVEHAFSSFLSFSVEATCAVSQF